MNRRRLFVAAGVLLPAVAVLALLAYGFTREPRYIESPIDYGVWGLPETFIIDRTGRMTYKHIGTLGSTLLAAKIDEAHRGVVNVSQGRGDYQSAR